jgi:hypothetical protein
MDRLLGQVEAFIEPGAHQRTDRLAGNEHFGVQKERSSCKSPNPINPSHYRNNLPKSTQSPQPSHPPNYP